MPKSLKNPKIPTAVREMVRKSYAVQLGERDRIERYEEEVLEFETNLRFAVEQDNLFENIGQLI